MKDKSSSRFNSSWVKVKGVRPFVFHQQLIMCKCGEELICDL